MEEPDRETDLKAIAAVIAILSFIVSSVICSAILFSKRSRSKGFNLYLVFVLLPDIIINLFGFIWYTVELSIRANPIEKNCKLYVLFGFMYSYYVFANMWTNVLVCNEVHQLLVKSHNMIRFKQSDPKTVVIRASIVNIIAILLCCIFILLLPVFHIEMYNNMCTGEWDEETGLPIWQTNSEIADYVLVNGLSTCLPLVYIIYVTVDVYWRKLLPPTGKSRFIATFFLRIAIISSAFTIILTIFNILQTNALVWVATYFLHLQGLFVAGGAFMKPDVRKSVLHMFSCGSIEESNTSTTTEQTDACRFSLFPIRSMRSLRSMKKTDETVISEI